MACSKCKAEIETLQRKLKSKEDLADDLVWIMAGLVETANKRLETAAKYFSRKPLVTPGKVTPGE